MSEHLNSEEEDLLQARHPTSSFHSPGAEVISVCALDCLQPRRPASPVGRTRSSTRTFFCARTCARAGPSAPSAAGSVDECRRARGRRGGVEGGVRGPPRGVAAAVGGAAREGGADAGGVGGGPRAGAQGGPAAPEPAQRLAQRLGEPRRERRYVRRARLAQPGGCPGPGRRRGAGALFFFPNVLWCPA